MNIRTAFPVAKKVHVCVECGHRIQTGQRHYYAVGNEMELGGFYAMRECLPCFERRTGRKVAAA